MLLKSGSQDLRAVLLFPDGLAGSGSELVRGVQKMLPPGVPALGGAAADDFNFQKTFQYFDDQILTNGAVGVAWLGDLAIGVGVRHGWMPLGKPWRVTRAAAQVIYQLNHRPAVTLYEDYLGLAQKELKREPLASATLVYPLGSAVAGQTEYLLHGAIALGKNGSLICTGDVPEGGAVRLMIGGYESALQAARLAAEAACAQLGKRPPKGALVFCSAARQKMLGSEYSGEMDVIRDALGGAGVCMGGFYTYGEIAPLQGANAFHNDSVVVMALG